MVELVKELPGLEVYVISGRIPGRVEQALRETHVAGGTVIRDPNRPNP
jgi:isopentenyl phosphate kinase